MPGSRACNQQNDSRREVKCGICGQNGRRDNLKTKHFPRKHPGMKYVEEGDKQLKNVKDFLLLKITLLIMMLEFKVEMSQWNQLKSQTKLMRLKHMKTKQMLKKAMIYLMSFINP